MRVGENGDWEEESEGGKVRECCSMRGFIVEIRSLSFFISVSIAAKCTGWSPKIFLLVKAVEIVTF